MMKRAALNTFFTLAIIGWIDMAVQAAGGPRLIVSVLRAVFGS